MDMHLVIRTPVRLLRESHPAEFSYEELHSLPPTSMGPVIFVFLMMLTCKNTAMMQQIAFMCDERLLIVR